MRRLMGFGLVASLAIVMSLLPQNAETAVVVNLLSDSGFEDYGNPNSPWTYGGNAGWSCDTSYTGAMSGDIGGWRGTPGPSGNIYQSFMLPSGVEMLEFGAYFNIITSSISGNWDQAQINLQISVNNDTTIGGSISNFPIVWEPYTSWEGATEYRSGWFLVSGLVDVSQIGDAPASINISLQDYSDAATRMYVDDVYAGQTAPVPEPSTMILLGSGLVGLIGLGGRRMKK